MFVVEFSLFVGFADLSQKLAIFKVVKMALLYDADNDTHQTTYEHKLRAKSEPFILKEEYDEGFRLSAIQRTMSVFEESPAFGGLMDETKELRILRVVIVTLAFCFSWGVVVSCAYGKPMPLSDDFCTLVNDVIMDGFCKAGIVFMLVNKMINTVHAVSMGHGKNYMKETGHEIYGINAPVGSVQSR